MDGSYIGHKHRNMYEENVQKSSIFANFNNSFADLENPEIHLFSCICSRCLEKVKHIIPNGGLMVAYHCTKSKIILNKSKFWKVFKPYYSNTSVDG